MVVDRAARQVGKLGARSGDLSLALLVGEAHHRVGVGHVEVAADQRHAERREQVPEEDGSGFGAAVPIGVAQERDPVGAGDTSTGHLLNLLHGPALEALGLLGRLVGFGDQHVAVGQDVDPARTAVVLHLGRAVTLGAELNAELELQTRRDTTTDPVQPMGERGAFVADHVATD